MKLKFICSLAAAMVLITAAFSQSSSAPSSALPSAPGVANDSPAAVTNATGSKVGAINVEQAIFASNEGQRDMEALGKKFEPRSTELKSKNAELEALKKQTASATEDKKADIQRQVEVKQKALERDAQDARDDFQTQQNEIGQRIFQKMGPLILKYAGDNGLGVIIDTSTPWPQGPVLWAGPSVDITKAIVDAYNAQSGVAAPPKSSGSSGTGTKPPAQRSLPAPQATKPAATTPPAK